MLSRGRRLRHVLQERHGGSAADRSGFEKPPWLGRRSLPPMKTMTCKQLGGPCNVEHHGKDHNEVIKAQDRHLKAQVAAGDETHREAHEAMRGRWKRPVSGLWVVSRCQARVRQPAGRRLGRPARLAARRSQRSWGSATREPSASQAQNACGFRARSRSLHRGSLLWAQAATSKRRAGYRSSRKRKRRLVRRCRCVQADAEAPGRAPVWT